MRAPFPIYALVATVIMGASCSSERRASAPANSPDSTAAASSTTPPSTAAAPSAPSTTVTSVTSVTSGAPLAAAPCGFVAPGLTEGVDLSCGTVAADGATVFVTMVGAATATSTDPIIHLPGGPGASSEAYAPILGSLYRDLSERTGRLVVLIDQRGTGRSTPFLNCEAPSKPADCIAAWTANKIDPLTITTTASDDDVVAVADSLQAPQINLWGASYGSRLALEVVRRHRDRVRSLLIESVDTQDTPLRNAAGVTAALNRITAACSADTSCATLKVDLVTQAERSMGKLATTPLNTALGPIDANVYASTLLALMQANVGESLVPLWVSAVAGNDALLAQAILAQANSEPQIAGPFSAAMNAIVNCGDIAPFAPQPTIAALIATAATPLDSVIAEEINAAHGDVACAQWPHSSDGPTQAVTADVPALVMAGAFDSNTPQENAELAAATLTASSTVSFPGYGHFPLHRGDNLCAFDMYAAFVTKPTANVDQSCVAAATFRVEAGTINDDALVAVELVDMKATVSLPTRWLDAGPGVKIAGDGSIAAVQAVPGAGDEALTAALNASGVTAPTIVDVVRDDVAWRQGEGVVNGQVVIATVINNSPPGAPVITMVAPVTGTAAAKALLDQIAASLTANP
jgi:pimeloyl-ACP methyl ester carboxylesterase